MSPKINKNTNVPGKSSSKSKSDVGKSSELCKTNYYPFANNKIEKVKVVTDLQMNGSEKDQQERQKVKKNSPFYI